MSLAADLAVMAAAQSAEPDLSRRIRTGIVGGVIGAIVTGLVIHFGYGAEIMRESVPDALGQEGLIEGWALFLLIGVVAGAIYAGIAGSAQLREAAARPNTGVVVGIGFGLVIWLVSIVVVGGTDVSIGSYPITIEAILLYVLYGGIIGVVYGVSPYT